MAIVAIIFTIVSLWIAHKLVDFLVVGRVIMTREYRAIICPECTEKCGVWVEGDMTDPGYREGIGENFEHDLVWYCSDGCLAIAIAREEEGEDDDE